MTCSGVDLVIGQRLKTIDLEPEGRCRHMTLTDDQCRDGSDLDPDLGVLVETLERRKLAGRRHGERNSCVVVGF